MQPSSFDDEFIYEEIDRKIEDRTTMIALMRDEALGAFQLCGRRVQKKRSLTLRFFIVERIVLKRTDFSDFLCNFHQFRKP